MSRAPLLVRSSPALGTGSYGGLPVMSFSSSAGNSDIDDNAAAEAAHTRDRRKGKSRLRYSRSTVGCSGSSDGNDVGVSTTDGTPCPRRSRRRSHTASSSKARDSELYDTVEGQQESGLEPRFTSGSATLAAADLDSHVFDGLQSSSGSSAFKDTPSDSYSDSEESSEEDLHDHKSPGHPKDDSPYALVRASVPPTDDTSLSINTPRMWALSIFFAILGSSTNLFFSLRYPSVSITPIIALLLAHPAGMIWDSILKRSDDPVETFVNGSLQARHYAPCSSTPQNGTHSPTSDRHPDPAVSLSFSTAQISWRRRLRLWLAQGRWNEKEHSCVYIASNVSFGFAFATDVSPHFLSS
jgi:hypothetical protein